jgi:nitrogen fixation protein FixH
MKSEVHDLNRRAAWRWGTLVVSLLGLQVAGGIMAIMLATGDASVAVVPDYHQKALHWDDEVALQTASQALGWDCDVSQIDEGAAVAGLRITITDGDSRPVELASGELQIYRHARAAEVRRVKVPAGALGMFELGGCLDADGLWQVTVDVSDRAGHRFAETFELYVTIRSNVTQVGRGEK